MKITFVSVVLSLLLAAAIFLILPGQATSPKIQTDAWTKEWWLSRHGQKIEEMKNQKVDLLMIGDSITQGWESTGKEVWSEFYAPRNAFNIGFSGDRTENVLWRIDHGAIDNISPKLVIVLIGTNNTGHRQDSPEETAAGIKLIVERVLHKLPETKILLLALFPRGPKADDKLRVINNDVNELISEFGDCERVFYLDVSKAFLAEDGSLPTEIMPDHLHLNLNGFRIWADAMEPTIERLMN